MGSRSTANGEASAWYRGLLLVPSCVWHPDDEGNDRTCRGSDDQRPHLQANSPLSFFVRGVFLSRRVHRYVRQVL